MSEKLIKCKACGNEMASSAKACPKCGAKNKKPIFKRVGFWILVVIVILAVVLGLKLVGNGGSPATIIDTAGNVHQMTAKELKKMEKENEAYFNEVFRTAKIEVEGTVESVETYFTKNGSSTIFDSVELEEGWEIYLLHDSYDLAKLSAGTKVKIKSQIYNSHLNVELQGCHQWHDTVAYSDDDLRSTKIAILD